MLRKSKTQTNQSAIYSYMNIIKCLTETVAVSTAHAICLRNLGLKVTPGFSLTLHVTSRRITAVMLQLVGDGRCYVAHHLHAALWEWALRPWCSASLSISAVQWQLMRSDGGEAWERKKPATYNTKRRRMWFLKGTGKAKWKNLWLEVIENHSFFRVRWNKLKPYLKIPLQKCTCFL